MIPKTVLVAACKTLIGLPGGIEKKLFPTYLLKE
jgi:hypothetical protein